MKNTVRRILSTRRLFLFVGVMFLLFTIYTIVAPITIVECVSAESVCKDPVYSRVRAQGQGKLAFVGIRSVSRYLETERRVSASRVIYLFPRKIRVDIITREPVVALRPAGVNEYTLFDERGIVIDVVNETALPTLTLSEQINTDQIAFVSQLYASLATYFGVSNGEVRGGALKVTINAMSRPYDFNYPVSGDIDRLLGATRVVIGELNVEHENPTMKTIDFRFKNPVVKKNT